MSARDPAVSVLMGVRNGGRFLALALESILRQTFQDLELIVVDDGSVDETPEILAGWDDSRLVVLANRENLGLTRSINRALAVSRGRYIARQDADDRSLPRRLERQLEFLKSHPRVGLVGTWVRYIDGDGNLISVGHTPPGAMPKHGTWFARRGLMIELGGYREAFRYAQDRDLYLRAAERHRIAIIPEELYESRFQGENVSVRHQELQARLSALARQLAEQRRERGFDDLERGVPPEALIDRVRPHVPVGDWQIRAVSAALIGDLAGYRHALRRWIRLRPMDLRAYARLIVSIAGPGAVRRAERARARARTRETRRE
jgi:glycosyltransferase involved in cell wall biosynthesis